MTVRDQVEQELAAERGISLERLLSQEESDLKTFHEVSRRVLARAAKLSESERKAQGFRC